MLFVRYPNGLLFYVGQSNGEHMMAYIDDGRVALSLNLMPPSANAVELSQSQYNDGEQYELVVERLGVTEATVRILDTKERSLESFAVDFGGLFAILGNRKDTLPEYRG